MLFNSIEFIILLIATLFLYYSKPFNSIQKFLLITTSFVFYSWHTPILFLLLLFSGTVNALISHIVFDKKTIRKLLWAIAGIVINLVVLSFFKYNKLIAETIIGNLEQFKKTDLFILAIPLPIGISFFTFQGISLVVDVFRASKQKIDLDYISKNKLHHWYHSLLYISFFPQLVAGPIIKAYDFMQQI